MTGLVIFLLACAQGPDRPAAPAPPVPVPAPAPAAGPVASIAGAESPVPVAGCAIDLGGSGSGLAGWAGSAACAEGARRWGHIPAADRSCGSDTDCALLEAHTCFRIAVRAGVAEDYRAHRPCVSPNAGACGSTWTWGVQCKAGCCVLTQDAP